MKLHITAAEPSGDLLSREVAEALRAREPGVEMVGIGGPELASIGIDSPFDISPLSILGLVEVLKAWPMVARLADAAADHIIEHDPDAAILTDSWGFNIRVGQRVRARAPHIRLVKLAGPQIWATRSGRARTLAETFDQVLCLNALELPHYQPLDIEADLIGNPALTREMAGDGAAFRGRHGLDPSRPVLLVLPGSRASELANVAPALMDAARRIVEDRPDVQWVAAPAPSIAAGFREVFADVSGQCLICDAPEERYDAMAAADLALACSGTVTSELAVQGTPMMVGYKVGWMTWALAKYVLYKHVHITILNIASGDQAIVPEFVQARLDPASISKLALEWLSMPGFLAAQSVRQTEALTAMGQDEVPAPERAAEAILDGLARARAKRLSAPGSE